MQQDDLIPVSEVVKLVSERLNFSPRHTQERVMKRSDFPKPVLQVGRRRLYSKEPVLKWLKVKH